MSSGDHEESHSSAPVERPAVDPTSSAAGTSPESSLGVSRDSRAAEVLRTLLELIAAQDRLIEAQEATIENLRSDLGARAKGRSEREQQLRYELHGAQEHIRGLRAKIEHESERDQELVSTIRRTLAERRRAWWQFWGG